MSRHQDSAQSAVRWWRTLAPLLVVTCFASLLGMAFQFGTNLENVSYDLRFQLRGPLHLPQNVPIVILAFDDKTYSHPDLSSDPVMLWLGAFATVIRELVDHEAAAIGVDFLFKDATKWMPEGQDRLVAAVLQGGLQGVPVTLGYQVRRDSVVAMIPQLTMAASEIGYLNLTTDSDDFVRRQELFVRQDGETVPGFVLAVLSSTLRQRDDAHDLNQLIENLEPALIGADRNQILINFRGRESFQRVSFADAYDAAMQKDKDFFQRFENAIVLLGEIGEEDRHPTPLYYWADRKRTGEQARTPGIEIHAAVLATMQDGPFIRLPGPATQMLLLIGLSLLCGFLGLRSSALRGILLGLGAVCFFFVGVCAAFNWGWWIYLIGPVTGAVTATGASQAANYILVGKEKRRLRSLFRRYVDDNVISQILETPNLTLGGEKRHVAVLFSDIFNFTTRSESMPPERLVSHLNRYLSRMVEAIQSNHGMIDKFMGDGIMAIFGAPLVDEEPEVNAVRASLAMIEALEKLNPELEREGIEPIRIGVGIHCGEAIVGNIGSRSRLEYTAIGDVVNTASRIEGLTRKLDGAILTSSQVYEAIRHAIPAEFAAEVPVKGKSAPIRVYRVQPLKTRP